MLISQLLDPAQISEWGWRLPFLPGILLGAVAYLMRRQFIDDDFTRVRFDELPLIEAFKTHGREILRGFVIVIAMGVSIILVFVYLATYLQQVDRISASRALGINTVRMMLLLVLTPLAGMVSDRVGRKAVLAAGFAGLVVLSWPLFLLLDHSQTVPILLGQCGFAALVAAFCGAMPAALVEMYPQRNRCSAMSFAYNASFGLAGGTAPMVAVYLMGTTHSPISPAVYLIAAALVSLAGVLTMADRAGKPLQ